MNDNDHVRAIRSAVLAIQNYEKAGEPLYEAYYEAVQAAEAEGLRITLPRTETGDEWPQPKITRELAY